MGMCNKIAGVLFRTGVFAVKAGAGLVLLILLAPIAVALDAAAEIQYRMKRNK